MAEIDLIPAGYRQYLQLRLVTRIYIVVLAAVVFTVIGGKMWTGYLIKTEKNAIQEFEVNERVILNQSKQIEQLKTQKTFLEGRIQALDILRGGPKVEQLFVSMSRAINPSTWITHWKFTRPDEIQEKEVTYRNTGYFLVKPKNKNERKSWRHQTHMELRGGSLDHSALADFVNELHQLQIIKDVRILKTATSKYKSYQVVDYNLLLTVRR